MPLNTASYTHGPSYKYLNFLSSVKNILLLYSPAIKQDEEKQPNMEICHPSWPISGAISHKCFSKCQAFKRFIVTGHIVPAVLDKALLFSIVSKKNSLSCVMG